MAKNTNHRTNKDHSMSIIGTPIAVSISEMIMTINNNYILDDPLSGLFAAVEYDGNLTTPEKISVFVHMKGDYRDNPLKTANTENAVDLAAFVRYLYEWSTAPI